MGGVDGPCWCAACWGPDCGDGWAANPPVDVVGIADWVGALLVG